MRAEAPHISVVTPVYGCARALPELYERLVATLTPITENFEIIMVNDHSPDEAWEVIASLAAKDTRVRGIDLSRNFGQYHAVTAGLDYAEGEWVVVMDCDLQDQPEEIRKLYDKAQEGYDVVFGRRYERKDTLFKRAGSYLFHRLFETLSGMKNDPATSNFSIVSAKVVRYLRLMREQSRYYPAFVDWLGFRRCDIDIEHAPRAYGKSTYSFKKLIALATDTLVSHSDKPLKIAVKLGFAITFLSLLYAFKLFVGYFLFGIDVPGWTSVMVSIYVLAGMLFALIGIAGLYIGKIFAEVKGRPLYVISRTTFDKERPNGKNETPKTV